MIDATMEWQTVQGILDRMLGYFEKTVRDVWMQSIGRSMTRTVLPIMLNAVLQKLPVYNRVSFVDVDEFLRFLKNYMSPMMKPAKPPQIHTLHPSPKSTPKLNKICLQNSYPMVPMNVSTNTYKMPTRPSTAEYMIIFDIAHFIASTSVFPNTQQYVPTYSVSGKQWQSQFQMQICQQYENRCRLGFIPIRFIRLLAMKYSSIVRARMNKLKSRAVQIIFLLQANSMGKPTSAAKRVRIVKAIGQKLTQLCDLQFKSRETTWNLNPQTRHTAI